MPKRIPPSLLLALMVLASAATPDAASAEPRPIDLRGRLQVDITSTGDGETARADVRRLYVGAAIDVAPRLRLIADANLASGSLAAEDVYLAYRLSPSAELTAGYIKPANVVDELTSDIHTLFLERSAYAAAFGPGRRHGVSLNVSRHALSLQAGAFGGRGGDFLDEDGGHLLSMRLFHASKAAATLVHIGASAYREVLPSGGLRVAAKPEADVPSPSFDTGRIAAERVTFAGLEGAVSAGPYTFQIELGGLDPNGPGRLLGGSAQIGYRFTGEARAYSSAYGTFGRVSPESSVGSGAGAPWKAGSASLDSRVRAAPSTGNG